jgi:hypothetical protein
MNILFDIAPKKALAFIIATNGQALAKQLKTQKAL